MSGKISVKRVGFHWKYQENQGISSDVLVAGILWHTDILIMAYFELSTVLRSANVDALLASVSLLNSNTHFFIRKKVIRKRGSDVQNLAKISVSKIKCFYWPNIDITSFLHSKC